MFCAKTDRLVKIQNTAESLGNRKDVIYYNHQLHIPSDTRQISNLYLHYLNENCRTGLNLIKKNTSTSVFNIDQNVDT